MMLSRNEMLAAAAFGALATVALIAMVVSA